MLWIERLGISIHLAMDGLSLLMVALTGLLGVLSVLCSWNEIQRRIRLLPPEPAVDPGGVIGVFLAIDLFLFFFFWEMMLVRCTSSSRCGDTAPMTARRPASTPPPVLHLSPRPAAW
ncbi:hypothetical protein ABFY67_32945 [Pseudomonas aeruginosa]|uniref:hypothetical protein n=1 Tax=Pseudomonas aeruginosa TaxID=287 RepID=UPI003D28CF99